MNREAPAGTGATPQQSAATADTPSIADIYDALGIGEDEHVSICHKVADGVMRGEIHTPASAANRVIELTGDVYFGINPVGLPTGTTGRRGTENDVTRLVALWADLDVKPGCCPNVDAAHTIIDDLSALIGHRPVMTIFSGHGLQPLWAVEDCDPATGRALLRRWGRMVEHVAATRNVKVDNVFDLARILRAPGTLNCKDAVPVETSAIHDTGAPMAAAEIDERLAEVGIYEMAEDGEVLGVPVTDPTTWAYGGQWCGYAKAATNGFAADTPLNGRHPFMLGKMVRLALMWRYGCVPDKAALCAVIETIRRRHAKVLATTEPTRKVARYEIEDAWGWAVKHVSRMTDEKFAAKLSELANHQHPDGSRDAGRADAEDESVGRVLKWRTASEVRDGVPEWAWTYQDTGCLMRSTLTLFAGRPGAGKSTAARWFAAGYTRGTITGCFEGKPQHVAYIASEESLEYMVKPSLRAVNADMDMIHFPHVEMDGREVRLLSTVDEHALTESLKSKGITIVIVDPVMSAIGSKVDINRNNEVRAYIEPWARIAREINGLVTAVAHLTKAPSGDIVAAINGSSAFGEVARSVIAFAKDPESEGHRVMSQVKNSAGPEDLSLSYTIASQGVDTDGGEAEVAMFVIGRPSDRSVSDVLRNDVAQNRVGPRSWEVIEAVRNACGPVTPGYVASSISGMTNDDAGKYLRRLADMKILTKLGRGLFAYPVSI